MVRDCSELAAKTFRGRYSVDKQMSHTTLRPRLCGVLWIFICLFRGEEILSAIQKKCLCELKNKKLFHAGKRCIASFTSQGRPLSSPPDQEGAPAASPGA